MPHTLKTFISRYRDELIGFCFVLSLITAIVTVSLFVRQSRLLKGVETTVKNDTVQINNQELMKDANASLRRKLDSINHKQ